MVKKHVMCEKERERELPYSDTVLMVQHFPISLNRIPQANANTLGQQHINVAKVTASDSPPDCRFGAFQRWRRQSGVVRRANHALMYKRTRQ